MMEINVNDKLEDIKDRLLHECCSINGSLELSSLIVKKLVKAGADIKSVDKSGYMALHLAAERTCNIDLIQTLLDLGADVNAKTHQGETALHLAVGHLVARTMDRKSLPILEVLLSAGSDINAVNNQNETPLHKLLILYQDCTYNFHKHIVISDALDIFFRHKADFKARTRHGQTALDIVMDTFGRPHDLYLIKALINYGSGDVNSFCILKSSLIGTECRLLHLACKYTSFELVKYLLEAGANIDALDNENMTPLFYFMRTHLTVRDSNYRLLEYLLERNPDVNVIAKDGSNILSNFFRGMQIPESIWQIMMEHLAKEKTLGNPLHPSLLRTISENSDYSYYFDKCEQELKNLKNDKISADSWLSWFNLLIDHEKKLLKYASKENFILQFNKAGHCKIYPIFGPIIHRRFNEAIQRKKFLSEATITLSTCLPPEIGRNHIIVEKILSCIEIKDLKLL